jgi:hypothetical protein
MMRFALFLGFMLGLAVGAARAQCAAGRCTVLSQAGPAAYHVTLPPPPDVVIHTPPPPRVFLESAQAQASAGGCYGGAYRSGTAFYQAPSYGPVASRGPYFEEFAGPMVFEGMPSGYAYGGRAALVDARSRNRMFSRAVMRGADISSYGPNEFDVMQRGLLRRIFR